MRKIRLPARVPGGQPCTKNLLRGHHETQLMKLWRKIVSVLAGTMIAAGGVLAVAAIVETAPLGAAPMPGGGDTALGLPAARTATQGDAQAVSAWLDDVNAIGAPTPDERTSAALGAATLAELSGTAGPTNGSHAPDPPSTEWALRADFNAEEAAIQESALNVVAAANSTPNGSDVDDPAVSASALVFSFASIPPYDATRLANLESRLLTVAPSVVQATRSQADAFTAGEPTDRVALKAATSDLPAPAYNWTASAQAELETRFDGGAL